MSDTRPNILWYCTDQQRFDTVAALGNEYVHTPTVDKLVEDGVAFTTAYCQSPICTPSRSSFMTGMYPSRVHNTRNGNDTFPEHPPLISKLQLMRDLVLKRSDTHSFNSTAFTQPKGYT